MAAPVRDLAASSIVWVRVTHRFWAVVNKSNSG